MDQSFSISGYSMSNMLTCVVDGADIYQVDYMGNRRPIGKTQAAYNELETTTRQYYDKLVELGIIVPQKTPEEMMMDMQNTMLDMSKIIASLSEEVKELKAREPEQHNEHDKPNVPKREHKRGAGESPAGD